MNDTSHAPGLARICVVDDDPISLAAIAKVLQPQFEVVAARTGREALRIIRHQLPDLVLLDIAMPDLDGFAVCRRLKGDPLTEAIPIVFLTSSRDEGTEERGLNAGASDFINKPARGPVVAARIHNLVQMKRLAETLRAQAQTDSLTGLPNRRFFLQELGKELHRARRNRQALSLMMIDIDHFKAYNDHYGHLGGDGALRRVGQALQGIAKRTGDLACRYGGEEFSIVLPATGIQGSTTVAAAVLAGIHALDLPHGASVVAPHVTLSIGLATLPEQDLPVPTLESNFSDPGQDLVDALFARADAALYEAKRHGRNQAWVHGVEGCRWIAGQAPSGG